MGCVKGNRMALGTKKSFLRERPPSFIPSCMSRQGSVLLLFREYFFVKEELYRMVGNALGVLSHPSHKGLPL